MSFLKETQKKMKQKRGFEKLKRSNTTPYSSKGKKKRGGPGKEAFQGGQKPVLRRYKKELLIGFGSLLALVLVIIGIRALVYLNEQRFQEENVTFSIEGQTDVSAGERQTYTVRYTNNNQVTLQNAELSLNLSDSFQNVEIALLDQQRKTLDAFQIGEIEPGESFEFEVSGRFVAPVESLQYLRGRLNYSPAPEENSYTADTELAVSITDSPLVVNVRAPQEVASGGVVEYVAAVNHRGQEAFTDLQLDLSYPEQFSFLSASKTPESGNSTFRIPEIKRGGVFEVRIRGRLSGTPQESGVVKAKVGVNAENGFLGYTRVKDSTSISEAYVALSHNVKGDVQTISAGEDLTYKITFENTTDVPIRNWRLRAKLSGELYDLSTLVPSNASFDASTNTLTWTPSGLPDLRVLEAGEKGSVEYKISLKDRVPVNSPDDKNYTVQSKASFESDEIPAELGVNKVVESNISEVKMHTKFFASSTKNYNSNISSIVNSGPNPPRINKRTTYTIKWEVDNLTNTVSGVKFQTSLPPNVEWTGQTETGGGDLTYKEGSRVVTWTIDSIPPHTGFLNPTQRAVFQVAITPPPNTESRMQLLKPTSYEATDVFTNKQFQGTLERLRVPLAQ